MKIRQKLTFRFTLIVALLMLLFSVSVYYFAERYREEDFNRRLKEKGIRTVKRLLEIEGIDKRLLKALDENKHTSLADAAVFIYDEKNQLTYGSENQKKEYEVSEFLLSKIRVNTEGNIKRGERQFYGVVYTFNDKDFVVIASAVDEVGLDKLQNLKTVLIVGFLSSIGIVLLSGWFYSLQILKPISRVIKEVDAITASKIWKRVNEGNGKDEIAQLASTFNRMLDRLEYAFKMQRSFVANASHELRTPLTAIRGQLEVTLMKSQDIEEYEGCLTSISEEINDLIKLTNNLLTMAQVGMDEKQIPVHELRIDEILLDVISECSHKYKDCDIDYSLEAEEMQEESALIIRANEQLIKTAFINIIDNACKYTSGKVDVVLKISKAKIEVEIIDYGKGIDESEINHLFEAFYRGKNSKKISGHGIGLSLARRIVEIHKGTINIDSKVNKGTSISIHFPHT